MIKQISKIKLLVVMTGLSMLLAGCCHLFLSSSCPPQINSQPQSQIAKQGTSVTFSISAKPEPLTYQWQFNGENIRGANGAAYTISEAGVRNVGEYRVVVQRIQNQKTITTSHPAFLSIITPSSLSLGNGGTLTAPIGSFGNSAGTLCPNGPAFDKMMSFTPFGLNSNLPAQTYPNPLDDSTLTISTTGNNPQLATGIKITSNVLPPHSWTDCGSNNSTQLTVSPLQNKVFYRVSIYFKSIPGVTTVSWSWLYH